MFRKTLRMASGTETVDEHRHVSTARPEFSPHLMAGAQRLRRVTSAFERCVWTCASMQHDDCGVLSYSGRLENIARELRFSIRAGKSHGFRYCCERRFGCGDTRECKD